MLPLGASPGRDPNSSADAFERMLDRGIVIDADFELRIAGLPIASVEARIVIAGIETYLQYAEAIANTAPVTWRENRQAAGPDPLPPADMGWVPVHRLRLFLRDPEGDLP